MDRHLTRVLLLGLALAAGCDKDSGAPAGQAPRGLPTSSEGPPPAPRRGLSHGDGADPHVGLDMGGGDPHAGLDMGGGADPHAGLDMANPNAAPAPVDPSKFLKGQIVATAETSPLIKPGAILFLSVKPIEPIGGQVIGSTMAVDRLDIDKLPIEFSLSGANAMMPTTKFEGDVLISARVDQDGEARSKQPGDVEGTLRAKIPAEGLTLTLDTVLK